MGRSNVVLHLIIFSMEIMIIGHVPQDSTGIDAVGEWLAESIRVVAA
jgi:hypothetical protein